ncbi:hypothetical protein DY000_02005189 [Brassica cretica]|uniref:Protein kinase domain-containing protein n=1 Tax=Brassica cretica TaxID=69181 RepID=A0ABQ7BYC1_BRACR|nr:hypothetical protein DY000_02005189 [Brassica cretica]
MLASSFCNSQQVTAYSTMLSFTGSPYWMAPEVAAIFKIRNSKEMPEIPDHLSNDAKNFIRLCLQRNPTVRPTAAQLLEHPFLRVHSPRVANTSMQKDVPPRPYDGSSSMVCVLSIC